MHIIDSTNALLIKHSALFNSSTTTLPSSHLEVPRITQEQKALAQSCIQNIETLMPSSQLNRAVIALGSGSTAEAFVLEFALWAKKHQWQGRCIASSKRTEQLAHAAGLSVYLPTKDPDIMIDGADYINASKSMIKGYGGALFREKILAQRSTHYFILLQSSKITDALTQKTIPVEVLPFAASYFYQALIAQGRYQGMFRQRADKALFVTDNNTLICDITLLQSPLPPLDEVEKELKSLGGVVETGIFSGLNPEVFIEDKGRITKDINLFLSSSPNIGC